jgi:ABC-type multidrug transport system ATPase subunit
MTPLLQLSSLLLRRDSRNVLDIQSLSVERGEVLAIVGPNGAGKSTLFLAMASLLRADRGQILFNGIPMDAFGAIEYRRRIAVVLEEPLLSMKMLRSG